MIIKKRAGFDIIDNDRFLCRGASYSDALQVLRENGFSERDAHIAMQRETSWAEYGQAWLRAVESEVKHAGSS